MRPDHRWGRQKRISTTASTPGSASRALLDILHRMNGNTYHVGRVVCLLVCGGRLGVRSILRWSSTNGTAASILAVARMGIACVSLRRGGTDHSFPYFNSGLLQQRGPPAARTPVRAAQEARSSPGQGRNITLEIMGLKCRVHCCACLLYWNSVICFLCQCLNKCAKRSHTWDQTLESFLCFIVCIHVYLH